MLVETLGDGKRTIQKVLIIRRSIMERQNISIKSVNGDILFGFAWECENPEGVVVIATGMEETAARYDDFAKFLNKNGYNVYCVDHYGQGENALEINQLGIVPRSFFSKSVRILDDVAKKYMIKGKPLIILGHSMGSFMVQDYIQRYASRPTKAVIIGTNGQNAKMAYSFGYPLARLVCKMKGEDKEAKFLRNLAVGGYGKSIKDRKTDCDWLSYNTANVNRYIEDPKCGHPSSNGFYRELLKGNHRLYKKKFLLKINKDLPIYITAGLEDPVGAFGKGPTKLASLYKKLGVKDVELKLYEHMRHEILNEDDNLKVYNDILNFIKK